MLVHEYEQNNKINSLDLREKSYVQLLIKELNDYSKLVIKKTPKYILHIVHVVRILDSSSQPLVNTVHFAILIPCSCRRLDSVLSCSAIIAKI